MKSSKKYPNVFFLVALTYLISIITQSNAQDGGPTSSQNCTDPMLNASDAFFMKTFQNDAVAADSEFCSKIGRDIFQKGGSAVDVAIATGICSGIINPQSSGIGGGNFMVIYLKNSKKAYAINAREKAPMNAYETMFASQSSTEGGLATAIPGEIAGYWEAYKLGGRLPWYSLLQPSIDICYAGYPVSPILATYIKDFEAKIKADPVLNSIFINPRTGKGYKEGDIVKNPRLGTTLVQIAQTTVNEFYNGTLANIMVSEINSKGGNVTWKDFNSYQAVVSDAVMVDIDDNYTLYTLSVPSSGVLVPFIMKIMKGFNFSNTIFDKEYRTSLFFHRLAESMKHAYAQRAEFGDEMTPNLTDILNKLNTDEHISYIRSQINDYHTYPSSFYSNITMKNNHGTTHISVVSNGDAISLTSTINTYFGAKYAGAYSGIIFNNEMDDFSSPNSSNSFGFAPSEANFIKPGKRPMSSMSPIIIVEKKTGLPKLVLGASGGSKILSAVAQVAIKALWLGMDVKKAIDGRRIHHQLYPTTLDVEDGFDVNIRELLKLYGHNQTTFCFGGSVVQGIYRNDRGTLDAYCDPRKGGIPAGI